MNKSIFGVGSQTDMIISVGYDWKGIAFISHDIKVKEKAVVDTRQEVLVHCV